MKIPDQIKIGGKIYAVEKVKDVGLSMIHCTAEIDYCECEIRIYPSAQQKMEMDFMHEVMHAIFAHLGYKKHNEKQIDELANALYAVIKDNPEMFEKD